MKNAQAGIVPESIGQAGRCDDRGRTRGVGTELFDIPLNPHTTKESFSDGGSLQ